MKSDPRPGQAATPGDTDMKEYEKTRAAAELMGGLDKGRQSGEEKGWLSYDAAAHFKDKINE
jgi:hypothetical protein